MLSVVALAANTFWVDSKTRAAAARYGGQIIDTPVVPANVRVEGAGPAIDWGRFDERGNKVR